MRSETDGSISVEAAGQALPALSRAELRVPQVARDGRTLPARSSGTIVEVLGGGQAYMIEFVAPFAALLTVDADLVRPTSGSG